MSDLAGMPQKFTSDSNGVRDIGYRFRGAFIEHCSRIEHWVTCVLRQAAADGGSECPRFLRQKLKALAELAETESGRPRAERILGRPPRVISLLAEFDPYVDLRADLAHSVQAFSLGKDGVPTWTFAPAGCEQGWKHMTLSQAMQESLVVRLNALAKRFEDQRFGKASPSSPPRPKPAAAAGP